MNNKIKTEKDSTEDMTLCGAKGGSGDLSTAPHPPASCVWGAQRGGSKATEEEAVASCE